MSRFIFPLQNILEIKEKLEDQEKNNYRQANMRLMQAEEELEMLIERREDAEDDLRVRMSKILDVQEIRRRKDAIEILKMYIQQQILIVRQCEKDVEVARRRLNEAMQERKTFEKLRERAYEEYKKEENLREQKEVDELVSYRFGIQAGN